MRSKTRIRLLPWILLLSGLLCVDTGYSEQIIGRAGASISGGIYVGKVRPFYWNRILYLEPINPVMESPPPTCTRRHLLRLADEETSIAFANKFRLLLDAWFNDRDVVLGGNGRCTGEGDELIMLVYPK